MTYESLYCPYALPRLYRATLQKALTDKPHRTKYITTVFQTASENLTINGLPPPSSLLSPSTAPPDDYIEVHEPLNNKLFERAKDLARQEEELVEEIAAVRRSMPAVAVEKATVTYKEGMQEDEEGLRMMEERISAEEREGIELGVGKLERQPDMEANWTKAIMGLERLKKTMPETVAKKERAQRAENYVTASDRKG